jgi:hypothetical protein
MKSSRSLLLLLLLIAVSSCGDETSSVTPPPSSGSAKAFHFSFLAEHMRALGTSGVYVAWFRYIGDSTFTQHTPMLAFFRPPPDSMKFDGDVTLVHAADSLQEILISVEPDTNAVRPSAPLMKGTLSQLSAYLTAGTIFGQLTDARATVTFATGTADTTRAQHEFYLMTLSGGIPIASAINLPVAAAGWRYDLWVTDSSYDPKHLFYYGSFADPSGPDSDTSTTDLPFPGGYRPNLLSDPGAEILLTLEPSWRLSGRPSSPLPFNVLQLPLKRFLHNGESIPMTNVAATGIPNGYFLLKKK